MNRHNSIQVIVALIVGLIGGGGVGYALGVWHGEQTSFQETKVAIDMMRREEATDIERRLTAQNWREYWAHKEALDVTTISGQSAQAGRIQANCFLRYCRTASGEWIDCTPEAQEK